MILKSCSLESYLAYFFIYTAELLESALKDWLPSQELFDRFSGEKKKAAQGNL